MPPKSSPELQKLHRLYESTLETYRVSTLSKTLSTALQTNAWPSATTAVSLGLGSLTAVHQTRRMKQFVIFLALADAHKGKNGRGLSLYAQDPTFTKVDETFLQSFGIQILRTGDESTTGEAAAVIDEETLVYTPFLTLQAYKALLESCSINYMIGDDFNALKQKFPKHSTDRADVELVLRQRLVHHRRRAIDAGDFWAAEEKPFPMAAYLRIAPAASSDGSKAEG